MTHKASEEAKAKLEPVKAAKEKLVDALNGQMALGIEKLDAEEAGEVTDMIKDLAEAEKACWEACYYKSVVEAMEQPEEEAMGYDRWRYASGRFAPTGRGTRGYDRMMDEPWPMGYPDGTWTADGSYGYDRRGAMGYDGIEPKDKLEKAMGAMGDIWNTADHETREKMKSSVRDLLYQMEQAK